MIHVPPAQSSGVTNGQMVMDANGRIYHIEFGPNGQYATPGGQRYNMIPGFKKPDSTTIPPPDDNPPLLHGSVVNEPKVPGGQNSPGKGVTTVNTEAMKLFAKNLGGLTDKNGPLETIYNQLDGVKVQAGGFHSAIALATAINSDGKLRDATKLTLGNVIEVLKEISDAMLRVATHYETAEEANKMSSDDYFTYLGTVSGRINGMGGGSH